MKKEEEFSHSSEAVGIKTWQYKRRVTVKTVNCTWW